MIWKQLLNKSENLFTTVYRASQVLLLQGKFWKIHYRCKTKGYLKVLFLFFFLIVLLILESEEGKGEEEKEIQTQKRFKHKRERNIDRLFPTRDGARKPGHVPSLETKLATS